MSNPFEVSPGLRRQVIGPRARSLGTLTEPKESLGSCKAESESPARKQRLGWKAAWGWLGVLVRGFFRGNTGTNHEQFIWLNSNDLTVRPHWESWFILGKLSPNGLNSGWWTTKIYPDSCPCCESSGVEMRNGSSGKSMVLDGFRVTHCWIFLRVLCECSRCLKKGVVINAGKICRFQMRSF